MARRLIHFTFTVPGGTFTHLDLTGDEAVALEERFGIDWGEFRPMNSMAHRRAFLETFAARADPEGLAGAGKWVRTLTVAQLEDAVDQVDAPDDLPVTYEDGLPKAEGGP